MKSQVPSLADLDSSIFIGARPISRGGKMIQRNGRSVLLGVGLVGVLLLAPAVHGKSTPVEPAAQTRTYYVAADEVNWDYAPSGRDEMMGHPFDDVEIPYVEPGPHRIGRVYKKAIYREYTDESF